MKVLVICGSIRAREANKVIIEDLVRMQDDMTTLQGRIESAMQENRKRLCNSEILSAAAMLGARQRGASVEYLPLVRLFQMKESPVFRFDDGDEIEDAEFMDTLDYDETAMAEMIAAIQTADGIVLATPVYFGDRSSVANKVMQITALKGLLKHKVFGVVSVGAKRNGGQETCNIYSMIEALNQGAVVVGNGPPTSQYGGTAVGGNKAHVLEDTWGLQSAFGVGAKVAHNADIFAHGGSAMEDDRVRIPVLITMDTDDRQLVRYLEQLIGDVQAEIPWVEFVLHEIIDATIYRCLGCSTCPRQSETDPAAARCAIHDPDDYLEILRASLLQADGAILAGLNILDPSRLIFRYQVLTERMRYVRRNDFELTDLLMASLCYNQFGATVNAIHSMKALTSYIRQNTTFHRPIEILEHEGMLLESGKSHLIDFCRAAQKMKHGKHTVPRPAARYETGGIAGGYK